MIPADVRNAGIQTLLAKNTLIPNRQLHTSASIVPLHRIYPDQVSSRLGCHYRFHCHDHEGDPCCPRRHCRDRILEDCELTRGTSQTSSVHVHYSDQLSPTVQKIISLRLARDTPSN